MSAEGPIIDIEPSEFQFPLAKLALTMSLKVEREGASLCSVPAYVAEDIGVLLRISNETMNLLFYINADERVKNDCTFKPIYTITSLPLVRNMIDHLYNITLILEDPINRGRQFRLSGLKKRQKNLDADEKRYGSRPEWASWIAESRAKLLLNMRGLGITQAEVDSQPDWMTLGKYLNQKGSGGSLTDHQRFLESFMYGRWREYSALAHGGPEALLDFGRYFLYNEQPFDDRPTIDNELERGRDLHMTRASVILLATITEIQAFFHFKDANIDSRLHGVWNAVMELMEAKELYDGRYANLMKDKSILP
jgi:uncharacterized protein Usg